MYKTRHLWLAACLAVGTGCAGLVAGRASTDSTTASSPVKAQHTILAKELRPVKARHVVKAKEFVLVDASGRVRARLSLERDEPKLSFYDEQGGETWITPPKAGIYPLNRSE